MISRVRMGIAIVFGLWVLGGCRRKRPAPRPHEPVPTVAHVGPKKPAPPQVWEKNYAMKVEGVSAEASFFAGSTSNASDDPWVLSAHFTMPIGSKIVMGKQSTTLTARGSSWHIKVPILELVGKVSAEDAMGKEVDLGLSFTVEMPGYEAFEQTLPPQSVREAIASGFGKIVDRPVHFPNEPEKPGPIDGVAVVKSAHQLRLLGSSKTVADIDWIAIVDADRTVSRETPCRGYGKPVTLQMFDSEVKIYDRRTASVIAEKKFAASSTCPTVAFVTNGKITNHADDGDIDKWARGELQKRKR